jgi:hypothetical protein
VLEQAGFLDAGTPAISPGWSDLVELFLAQKLAHSVSNGAFEKFVFSTIFHFIALIEFLGVIDPLFCGKLELQVR